MKTGKMNFLAAILTLLFFQAFSHAQTTAFNYQGRLTDGGNPATGNYQFQFKLFDALSGGNQIGATVSDVALTVTNGVFGTKLDFGANALSGANRWLEIAVRRSAGEGFVTLAPREQIASSPYSVRTLSAASADVATNALNLGGTAANQFVVTNDSRLSDARNPLPNNSNYIQNTLAQQSSSNFNISGNGLVGGNLGIGTTNPQSKVMAQTTNFSYGLTQTNGTATVGTYIDPTGGWLGTRSNHPLYFFTNGGLQQMALLQNGNFGIGNLAPNTRLTLGGGAAWTTAGWTASMNLQNVSALGWEANASGQRFGIGQSGGGLYFFRTNSAFGNSANPANYDLIINDAGNIGIGTTLPQAKLQIAGTGANGFTLGVEGNVTQNRDKGGFAKALIFVHPNGNISRCYNGLTGASLTGGTTNTGCGFTVNRFTAGGYGINFGFQVNDRFVAVTPQWWNFGGEVLMASANFFFTQSTTILDVRTARNSEDDITEDVPFMIIVY